MQKNILVISPSDNGINKTRFVRDRSTRRNKSATQARLCETTSRFDWRSKCRSGTRLGDLAFRNDCGA